MRVVCFVYQLEIVESYVFGANICDRGRSSELRFAEHVVHQEVPQMAVSIHSFYRTFELFFPIDFFK